MMDGVSSIVCTRVSDVGARICLTDACELPPEFELEIPSRGLRVLARRIWSRGANHGVMFLEKAKAGTVPPAGWPRKLEEPATDRLPRPLQDE